MNALQKTEVERAGEEAGRVFVLACCQTRYMPAVGADGSTANLGLRAGMVYLAELEETGLWRLFTRAADTEFYWTTPLGRVTTQTLESHFQIDTDVCDGDAYDLFGVLLPRDLRTIAVREQLKRLGGRWLPTCQQWLVPARQIDQARALLEAVGQPEKS